MHIFAVCWDIFSYAVVYSIGVHLMQVILIQEVEHVATRWCFVNSFALSMFIVFTALISSALKNGHLQFFARILFDTPFGDDAAITKSTSMTVYESYMLSIEAYQSAKMQYAVTILLILILIVCPAVLLSQVFRGIVRRSGCYMTPLQRRRRSRRSRIYVNVCRILTSAPVLIVSAALVALFVLALVVVPSLTQLENQQAEESGVLRGLFAEATGGKSRLAGLLHVRNSLIALAHHHSTRLQPHTSALTQRARDVLSTIRLPEEVYRLTSRAMTSSRNGGSGSGSAPSTAMPETNSRGVDASQQTQHVSQAASTDTIEEAPLPTPAEDATLATEENNDPPTNKVHTWIISEEYLLSYSYLLCAITARMATIGVALMGLLAGYAAFITPYNLLIPYVYWRSRRARLLHTVQILGRRQCQVLKMCVAKHRRIAQESYTVQRELPSSAYDGANLSTSETTGGVTTAAGLSQYDYSFSNYSSAVLNHHSSNHNSHMIVVGGGGHPAGGGGGGNNNSSSTTGAQSKLMDGSVSAYDSTMTSAGSPFIQTASLHRSLADTVSTRRMGGANNSAGGGGMMGPCRHALGSLYHRLISGVVEAGGHVQGAAHALFVTTVGTLARAVCVVALTLISALLWFAQPLFRSRRWEWKVCGGKCAAGGGVRYRSVIHQLREEADAAQCLSFNLHLEMTEVDRLLALSVVGKTWRGKLYASLGGVFCFYTLVSLVYTVMSLMAFQQSDDAQKPILDFVSMLETAKVLKSSWRNTSALHNSPHVSHGVAHTRFAAESSYDAGAGVDASNGTLVDWATTPSAGVAGVHAWNRSEEFLHGAGMFAVQVSGQLIFTLALLTNAWIVLSSIRGLILTFFELTLSMRSVITTDATAVGLAMLMGIYFLGQLVLLRQTLPVTVVHPHHPGSRILERNDLPSLDAEGMTTTTGSVLHTLLQDLPVYYYQRLYDWCFIIGMTLTVCVCRALFGNTVTLMPETHTG